MNTSKVLTSSVYCWFSSALFCVGLCAALWSLSQYPQVKQELSQWMRDEARLVELEQQFGVLDAVVKPFRDLGSEALQEPEAFAQEFVGAAHVEDIRQNVIPCDEEFDINRIELRLKAIPLQALMPFLSAGELQQPPLRLANCTIHASAVEPGVGDVVLKLERIERVGN